MSPEKDGSFHTLTEIRQQPDVWEETAVRMLERRGLLAAALEGCRALALTGSGSSQYAGECLHPALETELGLPAQTVAGGAILTQESRAIGPLRPLLLVSLARSGDSPESTGAVELLLAREPQVRHLAIVCNAQGKLATAYAGDPRVSVVTLDDRTNDRSLVMTSSFTSLVVAGRALGLLEDPEHYRMIVSRLGGAARTLLARHADPLLEAGRRAFRRVVYLAGPARFGAAREAALKMLEMTAGRVTTMPETYLGLRHGPMSSVDGGTLVVCFLSSDPLARAYELDLIDELNRKRLGCGKVILGESIQALGASGDLLVDLPGLGDLGDLNTPVLDVMAGQLLAFSRCLAEGLNPDAPSDTGVITRVVSPFRVHRRMAGGLG